MSELLDGMRREALAGCRRAAAKRPDHDAWQERHLIDSLRSAFHIPMTVFELDQAGRVPPSELQA